MDPDPDTQQQDLQEDTEQLVNEMMAFLDGNGKRHMNLNPLDDYLPATDSAEDTVQPGDEVQNPLCWAIKRIINVFPNSANSPTDKKEKTFFENRMHANQIEKACRYKDPYMTEVNRLMFCSSMGHPPNGSAEYHQAAENYALFGKEFLDFPTDIKFPQPMDVTCFGDISSSFQSPVTKLQPPPGFGGMQMGKYTRQFASGPAAPQQQILVNQTNYCGYPLIQSQSLMQPLIYSNPFLMTQYLNTFVKETQINTSLVQQQQFLAGGIQERLVYAQMLQQQIQTNQALMSCCFMGSNGAGGKCKPEALKLAQTYRSGMDDMQEQ